MKIRDVFIFIVCAIILTSCQNQENIKTKTTILKGYIFGTTYKIIYPNSEVNYQESVDSLFHLFNKSLSTYMPTSDISKINAGDTTVVIDDYFLEVFEKSKKIFKETDGYFDPTVGNLVNAWGFGPKKTRKTLTQDEIEAQINFVGFDKVIVKNRQIKKEKSAIYLDFNSIAKGFGIDVIGRFLESKNIANYLVEIGGEIRARGKNAKGNFWQVGIDNPNTDGTISYSKLISLTNQSMAGSGNYRKFRVADDGNKYVHTVNPKTGYATESTLLSAFVISKSDCADVDAYATAFMAMGFEKTKKFLQTHKNIDAILFFTNKNNEIEQFTTYNTK